MSRATVDELDDLDSLLLGHAHLVDLLVKVDVEAIGVTYAFDLLRDSFEVELLALPFVKAQHDVLCGRERIYEPKVLVHHANTVFEGVLGRGYSHGLALNLDLTSIGKVDAREHVHESCLAAAVLAKKGQYLAAINVKVHIIIGFYLAE
ncbi:MAG: hypothetical protein LKE43_08295 [Olsenella sp.]|jgi:hypothetical protein|nr:hypothetical protein [Olsenella sp.]